MSKQVTKAKENRYCQARLQAAKFNPDFLTRAGAVKHLPGIMEDSLKKYELEINRPPNIAIALMADAYNSPELRSWYCANECPLGKDRREIADMPPERALLRLKNAMDDIDAAMGSFGQIMDDGEISAEEAAMLPEIKAQFTEARARIDENIAALEKAEKLGKL